MRADILSDLFKNHRLNNNGEESEACFRVGDVVEQLYNSLELHEEQGAIPISS